MQQVELQQQQLATARRTVRTLGAALEGSTKEEGRWTEVVQAVVNRLYR